MKNFRLLALCAAELSLVVFIATLHKSIWVDEVLHFALAAFPSFGEMARVGLASIAVLNHGQTGFLMLLNGEMLRLFGASYFVLRLPSYLACFTSLTFGFLFLAEEGVSFPVGLLFVFLLGLSQLELEHGWEARPYIHLQATVVLFLWAWQRYMRARSGGLAWVIFSGALGVLLHPFFVVYAGMAVIGEALFVAEGRRRLLEIVRARRALLSALGGAVFLGALFLVVGFLGWFKSLGALHGSDPYEYVGHEKSLVRFMLGTFFYPYGLVAIPLLALLALALFWYRRERAVAPLVPPFLSLALSLVVTQALIAISVIRSQYWLLQRQWVAGDALAFLLAALLLDLVVRKSRITERTQAAFAVLTLVAGLGGVWWGVHKHLQTPLELIVPAAETKAFVERVEAEKDIPISDYEALARQNILLGGPVWPVFQRLYVSGAPH